MESRRLRVHAVIAIFQGETRKEKTLKMAGKQLMKAADIPAFVDRVIKAGCDICAIGHFNYCLGDLEEMMAAEDELQRIGEEFGDRDSLLPEIAAYLRTIGRYIDPGSSVTHWSENEKGQQGASLP